MATLITKNSSTASSVPTNAQLVQGELAVNVTDKRLYTENASGTVVELGTNPGSAVTHTAGTAGAPAITTTGDTNTGIFFPAADTVAASVGGTEGLRLTTTGLGVGTSTPNYKLQVTSAGSASEIVASNTAGGERIHLLSRNAAGVSYIQAQNAQLLVGTYDNYVMQFMTNNTTKMLLDTSGNLGLGVTPSAWNSGAKALQISSTSSFYGTSNATLIGQNTFNNTSGNNIYLTTAAASLYQQFGGSHSWYTAASGTAGNAISFTQAMTLTAGGDLGVGTTSPGTRLHVTGSNGLFAQFLNSTNSAGEGIAIGSGSSLGRISTNGASTAMAFEINATERARITSGGDLVVGTTGAGARLRVDSAGTTSGTQIVQFNNSSAVEAFRVRSDGAVFTGTSTSGLAACPYNNTTANAANMVVGTGGDLQRSTSSLKYKTDVKDAVHGLAEVMQLRPVTYKGKNDGDKVFGGLIAEEIHAAGLTEFVQYAEDGSPDALAYGQMVSLAFKAIQELKAELDRVKAELNALKGT